MAEYIEREALIKELTTGEEYLDNDTMVAVFDTVVCFPAADVVEVVHGEWVQIEYDEMMDKITCSHCKEKWSIIDNCTETFNYCPNCGAKMKGE